MTDKNLGTARMPFDDVYCWIEQEASIMLKAVTKFGDPVEMTASDAREVARALVSLADALEHNSPRRSVRGDD